MTQKDKLKYKVTTFYQFFPIPEDTLEGIKIDLLNLDGAQKTRGLIILAHEGINSTLAGPEEELDQYVSSLNKYFSIDVQQKTSWADHPGFHELKVKIRPEIVTLKRPGQVPKDKTYHLSPAEWNRTLKEEDVVCIDTRNDYETRIGKFKKAIDPKIKEFTQFPEYLKQAKIEQDKKILIYCTGGIRCEKAILDMHEQGYKNVYQLDGGILNYLKEFPNDEYSGECFVFDYRVAVDQELQPTKTFNLCVHCGDPTDHQVACLQCHTKDYVCPECIEKDPAKETCSKNCAHHYRMGHQSRRIHEDAHKKRKALKPN